MHLLKNRIFIGALTVLFLGLAAMPTQAAYPTKQITCIQPGSPGGGADALGQITQPILEKLLGKGFINQYLPGASGSIAYTKLSKQTKNDGYTIMICTTPHIYASFIRTPDQITYRLDDFEPLANIVTDPNVIVVSASSPFKTFEDFMEACKAKPGQVTVSNSGISGDDLLALLMLEKASGIKTQPVPFDNDGPSWQAAMGNKVDVSVNNLGVVYPQVKAGNLRILAIMTAERYHLVPDVPTLKEKGYDIQNGSSRGYTAPKGIPAEAKKALLDAIQTMAKDPVFLDACEKRALPVDIKLDGDFMDHLKKGAEAYGEVWETVKDQFANK